MWHKPNTLNLIANTLFALSAVVIVYASIYVVVHLPIFPLKEIKIEGALHHVSSDQVKLIVAQHLNGNFFTLDLMKTRDAFEKLPWARKVNIRRRWPDTLEVVIEEHQAFARWSDIALVNTHGEFFHAASNQALPLFNGPEDAVYEVAKFYDVFQADLKAANLNIATLTLTPRRAWQITTENNIVIELGRVDMQVRLAKFAKVYASKLYTLSRPMTYADLRYPNGFVVRRPT